MNRKNKYTIRSNYGRSQLDTGMISELSNKLSNNSINSMNKASVRNDEKKVEGSNVAKSRIEANLISETTVNKPVKLAFSSGLSEQVTAHKYNLTSFTTANLRFDKKVLAILVALILILLLVINAFNFVNAQSSKLSPSFATTTVQSALVDMKAYLNAGSYDETPATNISEYRVESTKPKILSIDNLGLNSRIIAGNNQEGIVVPKNIFDLAWLDQSAKAGEIGTTVISGRVAGPSSAGAFYNLDKIESGSIISIENGEGIKFNYIVESINRVAADQLDLDQEITKLNKEQSNLLLISNSGELKNDYKTHNQRLIVSAVLQK